MKKLKQQNNKFINDLKKNEIRLKHKILGEFRLKYISTGDAISFFKILSEKKLSDRELVIKILYNQLIKPKINFEEFRKLSDKDIIKIARVFIKNETHTFQYFKDTGYFFKDFKFAIKTYNEEQYEQIKNIIEPKIKYIKDTLNKFSLRFATSIALNPDLRSNINDCLQDIEKILEELEEVQLGNLLNLKLITEEYYSFAYNINEYLKPRIANWLKWIGDYKKYIFKDHIDFWKEVHKKYKITKEQVVTVLQKYKWFISPSLPISFIYKITELDRKKGKHNKEINKLFVDYFSSNNWNNTEEMAARWKNKSLFKKRFKILIDCVKTLKQIKSKKVNKANVVLPTLITQIDGILLDYLEQKSINISASYANRKEQFKIIKSNVFLEKQFEDIATNFLLNILFQSSYRGVPLKIPFYFNRHKIMHGENLKYGRKDYLIRAFLILDFLAHLK